ncbi:MAG: L-threonylcarbamoyladenylate synthase [Cyclobacteriaceae bacterium]|nr:L-threonylcarbamoyladenylate synthase [Cyclobacteriaceae bacterium]MCX7637888.1 L-threonylcarbamoyladenylate synthase [Cyclobacteriaceae bacterium]MDW8330482.1 L-threonylcarbamoyladenylate synthase [Cyclobacteriaceae bacterium]
MARIGNSVTEAARLLRLGEVVAIPTETVYGLAGNALNTRAVARIFEVKERPSFDPLIIHVPDLSTAKNFVTHIPEKAQLLAEHFWPGPLTLLLPRKKIIPDLVTSGLDNVAVRCPAHPLTQQLLALLDFPLAAPSANKFGRISPTRAEHVDEQLGQEIPYILDGGPCPVGLESTIIGFEDEQPVIYRLGGVTAEEIEKLIGKIELQLHSASNPRTPGQLTRHYAPRKKLLLGKIEELLSRHPAHCAGILTLNKDFHSPYQRQLSVTGNLREAAQNLFQYLRELEAMPVDVILAEPVEDTGLGRAINDRLRRAAATDEHPETSYE